VGRRITGDPSIKDAVANRIWVSLVLDLLAGGTKTSEILEEYPGIEEADVLACIAYGAEMSRERYIDFPVEGTG